MKEFLPNPQAHTATATARRSDRFRPDRAICGHRACASTPDIVRTRGIRPFSVRSDHPSVPKTGRRSWLAEPAMTAYEPSVLERTTTKRAEALGAVARPTQSIAHTMPEATVAARLR